MTLISEKNDTPEITQHANLVYAVRRWKNKYEPNCNERSRTTHRNGYHTHNQQRLRVHFKMNYYIGIDVIPMTHAHAALGFRAHNPYRTPPDEPTP